MIKINAGLILL